MDRSRYPAPLRCAIRELADKFTGLHVAQQITAEDAKDHLDDDVLIAWWALQRAEKTDLRARVEILEQLTPEQSAQFDAALITLHPAALRILHDATRSYVARWLADEADAWAFETERAA